MLYYFQTLTSVAVFPYLRCRNPFTLAAENSALCIAVYVYVEIFKVYLKVFNYINGKVVPNLIVGVVIFFSTKYLI